MAKKTIFDIAKEANVSTATVSRVINNNGPVKEKTKKKVMAIIDKYGFVPSTAARTLSHRQSRAIGVLIPNPSEYFFSRILDGISSITDENDYILIFCNTENSPAKELAAIRMLANQQASGLIITPAMDDDYNNKNSALLAELKELDIPVVFVDRSLDKTIGDAVLFNNYQGAHMAASKLIETCGNKIAAIIPDQKLQLGLQRFHGYADALLQQGISYSKKYTVLNDYPFSIEEAYQISKGFLKDLPKGSGVFLSNGTVSKGFLKALWETPLKLGHDIISVAFDKLELFDYMKLDFSYIDRSEFEMGQLATKMLFERIGSQITFNREYVIPARLIP